MLESMLREHFVLQAFLPPIAQRKQHKPSGAAGYPPPEIFSVHFILPSSIHKVLPNILSLKGLLATANTAFCINLLFHIPEQSRRTNISCLYSHFFYK